jgi:peptidylprolyl isomerase
MHWTRTAALVLTAGMAVAATACGSSTPNATGSPSAGGKSTTTTVGSSTTTTTAGSSTIAPVSKPTAAGTFGTAPPPITVPTGAPPTVLESSDLITGSGAVSKKGDSVEVQYVLDLYATDSQVQSSWTMMPFSFTLVVGQVIAGWDEGVVGMRVGGRRELIIPPALGYQSEAQPGIPANSTLVFVIDLLKVS